MTRGPPRCSHPHGMFRPTRFVRAIRSDLLGLSQSPKVKAAIFNEPGLKVSEVQVETFKGVVQLSGFVSSRADIQSAVRVASAVNGVTSVTNDMQLK
jgi:hypothetical protein